MKIQKNKLYGGVIILAALLSLTVQASSVKKAKEKMTGTWYAYITGTVTPPSGGGTMINPPVCVTNPNTPIIDIVSECDLSDVTPICCYYVETNIGACPSGPPPFYHVTQIAYGTYVPL